LADDQELKNLLTFVLFSRLIEEDLLEVRDQGKSQPNLEMNRDKHWLASWSKPGLSSPCPRFISVSL